MIAEKIVVRTDNGYGCVNPRFSRKGVMFRALGGKGHNSKNAYYEVEKGSIGSGDFRFATEDEISFFEKGYTNINDIPKDSFQIYL